MAKSINDLNFVHFAVYDKCRIFAPSNIVLGANDEILYN